MFFVKQKAECGLVYITCLSLCIFTVNDIQQANKARKNNKDSFVCVVGIRSFIPSFASRSSKPRQSRDERGEYDSGDTGIVHKLFVSSHLVDYLLVFRNTFISF